jgi:hypothetical protein
MRVTEDGEVLKLYSVLRRWVTKFITFNWDWEGTCTSTPYSVPTPYSVERGSKKGLRKARPSSLAAWLELGSGHRHIGDITL